MPGVPLSLSSFTAANKTTKTKGVFTPRSRRALMSEGFVEEDLLYVPQSEFAILHQDESKALHKRRFDNREQGRANKIEVCKAAYDKQIAQTESRKKENAEGGGEEEGDGAKPEGQSPSKKKKKTPTRKTSEYTFKHQKNPLHLAYGSPVLIRKMKKEVEELTYANRIIKNPNEKQKLKKSKSTLTLREQEERRLKNVQKSTQKQLQAMLGGELRRQAQINEFKRRQDRIDAMNLADKAQEDRRRKNAVIAAKKRERIESVRAASKARAEELQALNEKRLEEAREKKRQQDLKRAKQREAKRLQDELARAEKKDRIDRAMRKEQFKRQQMIDKMQRDQQRIAEVKAETMRLRKARVKVVQDTLEEKMRMKEEFEKVRNKLNPEAFGEGGEVDWDKVGLPPDMVAVMTRRLSADQGKGKPQQETIQQDDGEEQADNNEEQQQEA